ncbi:MAG: addiction module protein [Thermodesulfobacteriota bacterium]
MADPSEVLKDALTLKPLQRAELIDKLLASLDKPDKEIDEFWAKQAESRIDAYEKGLREAVALRDAILAVGCARRSGGSGHMNCCVCSRSLAPRDR